MINGLHAILYARDAEATRAFFKDMLGWPHVDAGRGWLIFAAPPAELAAHPSEGEEERHELYFMCDDVKKTVAALTKKGVQFTQPITDRGYGLVTAFKLPGGGEIGMYQPKHPIAAGKSAKPGKSPARKKSKASTKRKR